MKCSNVIHYKYPEKLRHCELLLKSFQKFEKLCFYCLWCAQAELQTESALIRLSWAYNVCQDLFVLIFKLLKYFYIYTVCINDIHGLYYNYC